MFMRFPRSKRDQKRISMITEWVMEEPIRRTPVPVRMQRQESSDRCIEIQPPG